MPEQHHGMSPFQKLLEASSQTGIHQGFFGRMLPKGHVVERKDVQEALKKLADSMNEGDNEDPSGDSDIPDGYVFLGQFIDHDITFDTTSGLNKVFGNIESIPNIRTPILDLDSLYGDGPEVIPFLYQRKHPDAFLIGSKNNPDDDLPRNIEGRALIPESRNDENGIISQLHLLFMKFHNAVLEGIDSEDIEIFEPVEHKDVLFEKAKRAVQRHYQWIVHKDFLPRIITKEVLEQAEKDIFSGDYQSDPIWGNAPIIPIEFAGAAYRFGHTLTRSHYHINDNRLNIDLFENFRDKPGVALSVFNEVHPENIVDWRYFFEIDSSLQPQKARKIDTWMAKEFLELPFVPPAAKASGENSLAFRNLLRGTVSYSLPSGEEVAKAFGVSPIPLHDKVKAAGLTETPLWFYCLAEAEAQGGKLGAVGGRIVAMTLLRILKEDPKSYVNAPTPWKPYLGEGDDFTMADLVKFVQKHEPKKEKEVVKFGEEFYLKSSDGRYVITASQSNDRYKRCYPLLGSSGQVKLVFQGGNGELTNNATVQILTQEGGLPTGNILGAWRSKEECYYWADHNSKMQSWQITKVDKSDPKIYYGDRVYFSNIAWNNQRLMPHPTNTDYITGKMSSNQYIWVLEKPGGTGTRTSNSGGGAYT
ncbi:MAG: heme peroxidase family protein [Microcoleaceae cyanobacterium MO_207.B10]|nr:heme peroxidase family protein [Microcoleaceae cyanobacterium MO_207.B10]